MDKMLTTQVIQALGLYDTSEHEHVFTSCKVSSTTDDFTERVPSMSNFPSLNRLYYGFSSTLETRLH